MLRLDACGCFGGRADALIEQHLESTGLHRGWWDSAKAAIAYCEQGEWFEPVMSQDGVYTARDLVALTSASSLSSAAEWTGTLTESLSR